MANRVGALVYCKKGIYEIIDVPTRDKVFEGTEEEITDWLSDMKLEDSWRKKTTSEKLLKEAKRYKTAIFWANWYDPWEDDDFHG